jgi:multidrug efflux pump subunit AcrB
MRPIPIGASAAMIFSLLVAFVITPWLRRALCAAPIPGIHEGETEDRTTRAVPHIHGLAAIQDRNQWLFPGLVTVLLLGAFSMVYFKLVVVKMLPFDNKSEFQVIVDMPEGTSLEDTAAATRALAVELNKIPEITDYQTYVGTASPFNFNGLVRHYYTRAAKM